MVGIALLAILVLLNLGGILQEEVDVVERIHQAILLIAIDVECLAVTCGEVCNRLVSHVNAHLSLRISLNSVEQLLLELAAHDDGEHEAVEQVVAVNISKRATDDYAGAIASDSPCGMLAA